jgi:hypothetical protein
MKTKPAKLLMAMLLGMGSLAFVSTSALADNSKDSKDSKDSSGSSSSTPSCTGQPMSTCGLNIVKITCAGTTISASSKDKSGKDEGDDDTHKSKDKDSNNKNDRDYNDDMHKDHHDHSADASGNKVSICHRMGGAEVSLTVANDGWLSGHSKHALDTIGRCADFDKDKSDDDSKSDKDKDSKISASDVGYSLGVTTTQIACLKGSSSSSYTIGGKTYPGANLNGPTISVVIKGQSSTTTPGSSQGATQGSNTSSSRGGAKTLH